MRADPDYAAYVVARWAPVVRVLVLLGVPVAPAEDLAVTAFARILLEWGRLRRDGDVDVELARLVLDAWARSSSTAPMDREPAPVPAGRLMTQELEDQLALLERLSAGLVRIEETARVVVVLRHLGELAVEQISDVIGEPPAEVRRRLAEAELAIDLVPLDPACHQAAGAIDVPPPSLDRVVARASRDRRRRSLLVASVVATLAVVAGVTFAVTRPQPVPDTSLPALEITKVDNPVGVAWWLDGTLHLQHGTAEVDDVRQVVETGVGVVYADGRGNVVAVDDDGTRERAGIVDLDTRMVSQPTLGLVAFLEAGNQRASGALVVYNVITHSRVGTLPRTDDMSLVGWDRDRLFVHSAGRDQSVAVGSGSLTEPEPVALPEGLEESVLVDVASGAELRRQDGGLTVVQPFYSVSRSVPGDSGQLSVDGNYVISTSGVNGPPSVYDARDGEYQEPWIDATIGTPVRAVFTSAGRIVWVLDTSDGSYGMYECQVSRDYVNSFDPEAEPCSRRIDTREPPVLGSTGP